MFVEYSMRKAVHRRIGSRGQGDGSEEQLRLRVRALASDGRTQTTSAPRAKERRRGLCSGVRRASDGWRERQADSG